MKFNNRGPRETQRTAKGRHFSVLLCVLCCWTLLVPAQSQLRAGAATVSITPDPTKLPYTLGGYGDLRRFKNHATGIHDACYARALVLEYKGVKCALVSVDLCFLPANVKDAVAARLGATGIPGSALFLSATHSHSAPDPLLLHSGNIGPAGELPGFDQKLLDYIAGAIAQSIVEANGKLAAASIGSGQKSGIGLNRNRRGEKITDDEMTALKVQGADGKPLALVVNYAAHPVYYGAEMLQVSGDWVGTYERMLETVYPGSVALFINGAEGDASPNGSDVGTNAEKIEIYATKLLQSTRSLTDEIAPPSISAVSIWTQTIDLPRRLPHPLFLLAASQLKATPDQAKAFVDRLMPDKCDLTFLRVGDALLMGVPGEPTAPVGLAAKQLAREHGVKHPAIVALTNGWLGYLVTAEQYKAGRYEPTMSFYGPGIGQLILDGIKAGLSSH
jgi:neutral ceramidase